MKPIKYFLLGLGIVGALVVTSISAQAQGASPTRVKRDPVELEMQRRFESEAIARALEGGSRRQGRKLGLAQTKADFLRIQVVNNDLRTLVSRPDQDLKLVEKSASEISKCADRLKYNLALPEVDKPTEVPAWKTEAGIEQLRLLLAALSSSIDAFVQNPVFERSGVVDAKLSIQARRDLDQILETSKHLKRSSEKLRRAGS